MTVRSLGPGRKMFAVCEVAFGAGEGLFDSLDWGDFLRGGDAKGMRVGMENQDGMLLLNPWRNFCGCLLFRFLHHFGDRHGDSVLFARSLCGLNEGHDFKRFLARHRSGGTCKELCNF